MIDQTQATAMRGGSITVPKLEPKDKTKSTPVASTPGTQTDKCIAMFRDAQKELGALSRPDPYASAIIDAKALREIVRATDAKPRRGKIRAFGIAIEAVLVRTIARIDHERLQLTPSKSSADLDKIERAGRHLIDLIADNREAQDAMFRTLGQLPAVKTPLCVSPHSPPVFVELILRVLSAAQQARELGSDELPYVRDHRDRHPQNCLIEELLVVWEEFFDEPATFSGTGEGSGFVALVAACFSRVGIMPQSMEALAKSCARVAKKVRAKKTET